MQQLYKRMCGLLQVSEAPGRATTVLSGILKQSSSLMWAAVVLAVVAALATVWSGAGPPVPGAIALTVFVGATLAWVSGRGDATFVGLIAVLMLIAAGVVAPARLFAGLGDETVWLLIAAFVLAAGIGATGLPARVALALCARARTVRQLFHLVAAVLVLTAFALPATAGRAALVLPVFVALAASIQERVTVVRALSLLFPTVVLLSAMATLTGAGAHLITSQLLAGTAGGGISYVRWLVLGLPFALICSHLATEGLLRTMTDREERRAPLVRVRDDSAASGEPVAEAAEAGAKAGSRGEAMREVEPRRPARPVGPGRRGRLGRPVGSGWLRRLGRDQARAGAVLLVVVVLWCTEALHGIPPAVTALAGAVMITAPRWGTIGISAALDAVPWSLLLFMVTTTVLGGALASSGAADWLTSLVFPAAASPGMVLVTVVVVSAASHLMLQSRSARSSVLVPLVIPLASTAGLQPAALAFASTAAAGFCHTTVASAKPLALFAQSGGGPVFDERDLLRLSAWLGPVTAAVTVGCALTIWPWLGLPLR
ncbi:SLC13 family permease [Streptomyces olivaceiscleroticus]|uniref:SLC13 family permease n=2 Tax=Streptomyces olivaceiscleroticus TaxID=68245 RepID=A0ABN0ZKD3_9ACTN